MWSTKAASHVPYFLYPDTLIAQSLAESQKDDWLKIRVERRKAILEELKKNCVPLIIYIMKQFLGLLSRHANYASRSVEMGGQGLEKVNSHVKLNSCSN